MMEGVGHILLLLTFVMVLSGCAFGEYGDVSFQKKLMDRIEALEKQGQEQAILLTAQRESMMTMEVELEDQSQKLLRQDETIREYKHRLELQDETIREYKHRLGQLEKTVAQLQATAESTTELSEDQDVESDQVKDPEQERQYISSKFGTDTATQQKRALVNSNGAIAFHAVSNPHRVGGHVGINEPMVFSNMMLNSGSGYNNQRGVFTAPRSGIYIFSTSILSFVNDNSDMYVHLVKNGHGLANAFAHGDSTDDSSGHHDQGSVTVVTRLAVGDEVWVSMFASAGASLWAHSYDSFTGCLVIPE